MYDCYHLIKNRSDFQQRVDMSPTSQSISTHEFFYETTSISLRGQN